MPHIKLAKGIPTALDQDSYFDVNKLNLIVFDNQMVDASKDKRIVNLFTRGFHHCNVSGIYFVQNLFHQWKGSRSISLNSLIPLSFACPISFSYARNTGELFLPIAASTLVKFK